MSDNKLKVISYALNDLHLKLTTGLKELVAAKVINAQQEVAIKDLINKYNAIPEYTVKQLSDASDGASISYGFYKGENRIGDIINIPQFLKDIIYDAESNTLSFIFQTSDGEAKVINTDITDLVDTFYFKVTYSELVSLRDESKLIPGAKYRITDYTTTTIQENTKSAGHDFDIIVTATSNSILSELAKAITKDGDTYFINQNLNAWQLWYNLDNDISKYAWADEENGKGVIYRMIDERFNDVPYDFKNIMIRDANNSEDETYYYTFSEIHEDGTISNSLTSYNNVISVKHRDLSEINFIIFKSENCVSNNIGYACYNITFNGLAQNNIIVGGSNNNLFTNTCTGNKFGSFFSNNKIGYCYQNTIGPVFKDNLIGDSFGCNRISGNFKNNQIGNSFNGNIVYETFERNIIGDTCRANVFGSTCKDNVIGHEFQANTFGSICKMNVFGENVKQNKFGAYYEGNKICDNFYNSNFGNWINGCNIESNNCTNITFGDGCRYIILKNDEIGSDNNLVQNYNFIRGLKGTESSPLTIEVERNRNYESKVAKNSLGEIKVYCEADLIA